MSATKSKMTLVDLVSILTNPDDIDYALVKDMPVSFITKNRAELGLLYIYVDGNSISIGIGEENECQ